MTERKWTPGPGKTDGEAAERMKEQRLMEARRKLYEDVRDPFAFSQDGIHRIRAACDRAETALRDAGKWKDE